MRILNRIFAISSILFILMPTTVAMAEDLQTITVTATKAPDPNNAYYSVTIPSSSMNQGPGYTAAMIEKAKYEAWGRCMNELNSDKAACDTAASNNLLANQGQCAKVAALGATVTAEVGFLLYLSGVGAVPGAIVTAATGAISKVVFDQCNNSAQNINTTAKIACDLSFNQSKLKCDAIKP